MRQEKIARVWDLIRQARELQQKIAAVRPSSALTAVSAASKATVPKAPKVPKSTSPAAPPNIGKVKSAPTMTKQTQTKLK